MKVGDIVVLQSGGPEMTVRYVHPDKGGVETIWFNKGKLQEGFFLENWLISPELDEEEISEE